MTNPKLLDAMVLKHTIGNNETRKYWPLTNNRKNHSVFASTSLDNTHRGNNTI